MLQPGSTATIVLVPKVMNTGHLLVFTNWLNLTINWYQQSFESSSYILRKTMSFIFGTFNKRIIIIPLTFTSLFKCCTVTDEILTTMPTNPNDDSTVTDETLTTLPTNPSDDSTTMPTEATGALSDFNNNGAIIGGVLAAALLLIVIIITVVVLVFQIRRNKKSTPSLTQCHAYSSTESYPEVHIHVCTLVCHPVYMYYNFITSSL